jgi:sulfane dehydrogenase subunit SoxC
VTVVTSREAFDSIGEGRYLDVMDDGPVVRSREDGIGFDELAQAARNHAMPLEVLRDDLTPIGLHYLLIHYDIPAVDPGSWRLRIDGEVRLVADLSLDELRERPRVTRIVTLECAGNGRALMETRPLSQPWLDGAVGTAAWTGTPLVGLLDEVGVSSSATEVSFRGLDRGVEGGLEQQYERSIRLADDVLADAIVADEMNGQPLLPQHGAPARLVVPGWYGMAHVKWLERIRLLDRPFEGYQQTQAYRWRTDPGQPGEPVDRVRPRSLMVPPGVPSFPERDRTIGPGPATVQGRAWSGYGSIVRVEVSTDGGSSWSDATLGAPADRHAWIGWTFGWDVVPGDHVLCCRATDETGRTQPMDPEPNLGGYANNAVQRIPVSVRST